MQLIVQIQSLAIWAIIDFCVSLVASAHVVLHKRNVRAAVGWVGVTRFKEVNLIEEICALQFSTRTRTSLPFRGFRTKGFSFIGSSFSVTTKVGASHQSTKVGASAKVGASHQLQTACGSIFDSYASPKRQTQRNR